MTLSQQEACFILSHHFRRIAYLWRDNSNPINAFETELIERERPSIVIQEMGERILTKDPPTNPIEIRKTGHSKTGSK